MNSILYTPKLNTTASVDVTEDVSLPDYVPEIRRVVGVRAFCTVDGKYMAGDALETDGTVTYTVLYLDGGGQLAQISQSTPYTGHIPMQEDVPAASVSVWGCAEQVSCRVTAPRRVTLSSRVKLGAMAQEGRDLSLKPSGELRRKIGTCTTASVTEVRGSGEVSGEIREKEGTRLVMASAAMALSDVRVGTPAGRITVKGDMYLTLLSRAPDGVLVTSRSRAPVEEILPLPERLNGSDCRGAAFGSVVLIEVENGEDGVMEWRTEYDIDCGILEISRGEITEDAYTVGREDEVTMEQVDCCTPGGCVNGRLTTSAQAKLRPGMTFVTAWGTVSGEKCTVRDGKMTVEGVIKLECVSMGEGESVTDEVQIPLKYQCDAIPEGADSDGEPLTGRVKATVTDVTARSDGDGALQLTAELAIAAVALGKKTVSPVTSVVPGEALPVGKHLIRVYIPDGGEGSWDVAKHFRLGSEAKEAGGAYVI